MSWLLCCEAGFESYRGNPGLFDEASKGSYISVVIRECRSLAVPQGNSKSGLPQ